LKPGLIGIHLEKWSEQAFIEKVNVYRTYIMQCTTLSKVLTRSQMAKKIGTPFSVPIFEISSR